MNQEPERRLQESWTANAEAWTRVVRGGGVESRRVATDAAVLAAVRAAGPRRVLDVGCGEGWLARTLAGEGMEVVGIDASEPLIAAARAAGGARFEVVPYQELPEDAERLGGAFDLAVCNFALLAESIAPTLAALRRLLTREGRLVIQTVHPWAAMGEAGYASGWRVENFESFGGDFREPMPWYFRTLEDWFSALRESGFGVRDLQEPTHPVTARPLSLLLVCSLST